MRNLYQKKARLSKMDYQAHRAEIAISVAEFDLREDNEEEAAGAEAARYRILVEEIKITPDNWLFEVPREDCVQNAYQSGLVHVWNVRDE